MSQSYSADQHYGGSAGAEMGYGVGGVGAGGGGAGGVEEESEDRSVRNVMVNFLPSSWTSDNLREAFAQFGNIEEAKVVAQQGVSKGFGFVVYSNVPSAENAIAHMNGMEIGGKTLKVHLAASGQDTGKQPSGQFPSQIYVSGFPTTTSPEELKRHFEQYGPVVDVKLLPSQQGRLGAGFVNFASLTSAQKAAEKANWTMMGGTSLAVRLSEKHRQVGGHKANRQQGGHRFSPTGGRGMGGRGLGGHGGQGVHKPMYNPYSGYSNSNQRQVLNNSVGGVYGMAGYEDPYQQHGHMSSQGNLSSYQSSGPSSGVYGGPSSGNIGGGQGSQGGQGGSADDIATVFVYGIPDGQDESLLWRHFQRFGGVDSCQIARQPDGHSRGFGFVRYNDRQAANNAVQAMNGFVLQETGRPLQVSFKR